MNSAPEEPRQLELRVRALEAEKRALVAEKRALEAEARAEGLQRDLEKLRRERPRPKDIPWFRPLPGRLSDDILRHILGFLTENDKFRVRRTSSLFYRHYYSATRMCFRGDGVGARRVVSLASMGRRFHRMRELVIELPDDSPFDHDHALAHTQPISRIMFPTLNSEAFPRLESLSLKGSVAFEYFGTLDWNPEPLRIFHSTLQKLKLDVQAAHIDTVLKPGTRLPNLRHLRIRYFRNADHQSEPTFENCDIFAKLETLKLVARTGPELSTSLLMNLEMSKFPKLRKFFHAAKLEHDQHDLGFAQIGKEHFATHGVQFAYYSALDWDAGNAPCCD